MSDKPILVTKVANRFATWSRSQMVLAYEFETENKERLVVHFTKGAAETLGIDRQILKSFFASGSGLQKLD